MFPRGFLSREIFWFKNRRKLILINTIIFFNNKDVEGFSLIVEPSGKNYIVFWKTSEYWFCLDGCRGRI